MPRFYLSCGALVDVIGNMKHEDHVFKGIILSNMARVDMGFSTICEFG